MGIRLTSRLRARSLSRRRPLTVLAAGETVHTSFRWQTEAGVSGHRCELTPFRFVLVGTPSGQFILASHTLLPQVCSEIVDDTDYHPGPFVPEWKPSIDLAPPLPTPPVLTTAKLDYFENERLTLHATVTDRARDDPTCPVLLLRATDAKGETRVDEFVNPVYWQAPDLPGWEATRAPNYGCHLRAPAPSPNNEWDLPLGLGTGAVWVGQQSHIFSVIQLAGMAENGEFRQVASNPVTINVTSATGIPRTWGKADKGVRADLTLDKQTYPLGQDVPLHLATEDIGAAGPVFDQRFGHHIGDTGMYALPYSFSVTMEDEHGQPIKAKQLLRAGSFRPLPCPTAYAKNVPQPREVSLADFGLLPDKPGVFRVFYTWAPYTTGYASCDDVPADPEAPDPASVPERPWTKVVSNVQTIRIVETGAVP